MMAYRDLDPEAQQKAKAYMASRQIPQLFESLTVGLLHHRPQNPVEFVQSCLESVKEDKTSKIHWNTFVDWKPALSRPVSSQNYAITPESIDLDVATTDLDLDLDNGGASLAEMYDPENMNRHSGKKK